MPPSMIVCVGRGSKTVAATPRFFDSAELPAPLLCLAFHGRGAGGAVTSEMVSGPRRFLPQRHNDHDDDFTTKPRRHEDIWGKQHEEWRAEPRSSRRTDWTADRPESGPMVCGAGILPAVLNSYSAGPRRTTIAASMSQLCKSQKRNRGFRELRG